MATKKFTWTVEKMIEALTALTDRHDEFLRKKKFLKQYDVYSDVALMVGASGEQVIKDLLKNIGRKYREVKKKYSESGAATEEPELKNSNLLYVTYEEYYATYFPVGGAVKPDVIVTANKIRKLGTLPKKPFQHSRDEDSDFMYMDYEISENESYGESTNSLKSKSCTPSPCPVPTFVCASSSTSGGTSSKHLIGQPAKKAKTEFLTSSASFQ